MRKAALYGMGAAILDVAANLWHVVSHVGQHVLSLPEWQLAYVILVIFIAPVAAAVLLWTRYRRGGAWLLLASMAGSFVFGLAYHFLIAGPDNAFALEPGAWQTAFRVSAAFLLLAQGTGCLVGVWILSWRARPSEAATRARPTGGLGRSHQSSQAGPR